MGEDYAPKKLPDDEKEIPSNPIEIRGQEVVDGISEKQGAVHAEVSDHVKLFDVECAKDIIAEAKKLNDAICKHVQPPIASNTQLHILKDGNCTYYLLGENHQDTKSLNFLEVIIGHLAKIHRGDILIYREVTPEENTMATCRETADKGLSRVSGVCGALICIQEVGVRISGINVKNEILPSLCKEVVEAETQKGLTSRNNILGAWMCNRAGVTFLSLQKQHQTQEMWRQIYNKIIANFSKDFDTDVSSLEEAYSFAKNAGKEWRSKIIYSMRDVANELTIANLSSNRRGHQPRHIIAICGASHLPSVFTGLGLESEMNKIKYE